MIGRFMRSVGRIKLLCETIKRAVSEEIDTVSSHIWLRGSFEATYIYIYPGNKKIDNGSIKMFFLSCIELFFQMTEDLHLNILS